MPMKVLTKPLEKRSTRLRVSVCVFVYLELFCVWYSACLDGLLLSRHLVGFPCVDLVLLFFKEGRFVRGRKGFREWGLGVFKSIQYALWKREQGIKRDYQQCEEKRQENGQDGGNWEKRQIWIWQLSTNTIKHDAINMSLNLNICVQVCVCVFMFSAQVTTQCTWLEV